MTDKLQETENSRLDATLDLGITKCLRDAERLRAFPHVTRGGEWLVSEHGRWTAGFFVGMLWIAGLVRNDTAVYEIAASWNRRLCDRALDRSTHDIGFLFEPSAVRAFNALGAEEFRDMAIQAARSLASRFHPQGHFIPAWSPEEDPSYIALAIVDTIMNVSILLWAGREVDDPELWSIGERTAFTIRDEHVRSDGSTYHTVDHDPETGEPTVRGTHQGAHAESCWSRGQAWAIYGFTKVAGILDSEPMMVTACRVADYFLARLGERMPPPWDFKADSDDEPRDSAAGAIAASGLLELGRLSGEAAYSVAGRQITLRLIDTCVDFDHPDRPGLLMHGTVDYPRRSGIDESIMYGDHYFMEALVKLRRPDLWDLLGCGRSSRTMVNSPA